MNTAANPSATARGRRRETSLISQVDHGDRFPGLNRGQAWSLVEFGLELFVAEGALVGRSHIAGLPAGCDKSHTG